MHELVWIKLNKSKCTVKHLFSSAFSHRPSSWHVLLRTVSRIWPPRCKADNQIIIFSATLLPPPTPHGATANIGHRASSFLGHRDHIHTHLTPYDSSGRVISLTQRPLPDNIQHTQEKENRAFGRIRTRNPCKRAAADPCIRPRGRQSGASKFLQVQLLAIFNLKKKVWVIKNF